MARVKIRFSPASNTNQMHSQLAKKPLKKSVGENPWKGKLKEHPANSLNAKVAAQTKMIEIL